MKFGLPEIKSANQKPKKLAMLCNLVLLLPIRGRYNMRKYELLSKGLCSPTAFPLLINYIYDTQMVRHVKLIVVTESCISPVDIPQQLLKYFHNQSY